MRYCFERECENTASCMFCIHFKKKENYEYECKLFEEEIEPHEVCDEFDCYKNYN